MHENVQLTSKRLNAEHFFGLKKNPQNITKGSETVLKVDSCPDHFTSLVNKSFVSPVNY